MFKVLLPTLLTLSCAHLRAAEVTTGSLYTDIPADCVQIESSNQKAEIDFARSECKSFGGYRLEISGGDLRYAPRLFWAGKQIDLRNPGAFHDMGSAKVEWVYEKTANEDGSGDLRWVGFIYRLSVSNPEGDKSLSKLYAVRLDQGRTCPLGEVPGANNELARQMVLSSKSGCR